MLDGVEGLGRVRLDEKAGEKLDEFEEKFNVAFKEVLDGLGRVRVDEQQDGREEMYLGDW